MNSTEMESSVDTEQLRRVFADHPWLVEVLREADWWVHNDGTYQFKATFEDLEGRRAGIIALVEALGHELEEHPPGAEFPPADVEGPPVRFEDLPHGGRARSTR